MVVRMRGKEERGREWHSSAVIDAHLLLRRGAEHGQGQKRFRGCESALLAVYWGEWTGVVAVRWCGEVVRLGWPFIGELGLVVDAVQGWGWGVGERGIGGATPQPLPVRTNHTLPCVPAVVKPSQIST